MQPKSMSWMQIRENIANQIASGRLSPGQQLPSEAELSKLLSAGRHSVRRALSALSAEGRLRIEHGRGAFVIDEPSIQYTIDRRNRLFDQLERDGHRGELSFLASGEQAADKVTAQALDIAEGAQVHVSEVLILANGTPLAMGKSYHPLPRFSNHKLHRRFAPTQRMFYRSYGISEYFRGITYLWARTATHEEAELLQQHLALPIVETRARDNDASGKAIGFSTTIWAGSRIRFVLPQVSGVDGQ